MSLSLSLPPPALTFLKWLEITQGRDKLYRFIQYGSKFLIQQMKDHGGDKDFIERLTKGSSAVGMTRKLMRFFRSMEYTQEFLKSINLKDEFERYLSMLKAFCLFVWMAADHVQWMNKAGYLKLGATPKIDEIHSKAWLYGLFFGVVLNIYKLRSLMEEQKSKAAEMKNHEAGGRIKEGEEAAKKIIELDDKKNKQIMGIVKNGLDMFIPIQRLQWLPISEGTAGLAGTITSVIGIRDTWPAATPNAAKSK